MNCEAPIALAASSTVNAPCIGPCVRLVCQGVQVGEVGLINGWLGLVKLPSTPNDVGLRDALDVHGLEMAGIHRCTDCQ